MKTRKLIACLMLMMVSLCTFNAFAGNEETFNSEYKISPDLNFNPNSGFQKKWDIAYGESKTPVHVYMKETKKGQEYLVQSKYFEVKYVNGTQGFGVRLITGSESTVSENLNTAVLNQEELTKQKCITPNVIENGQVLEMIASYLPDLINAKYSSILN